MTLGAPKKYPDAQFITCVRNRGRATAAEVAETIGCHPRIARNRMNRIEALGSEHEGSTHVFFVKEGY